MDPETKAAQFHVWVRHYEENVAVQTAMERDIDWAAACELPDDVRAAFVRSFQRFELGENGDGARLLAKAERAGDPVYTRALRLLVAEEQRHSALFRRGLEHLGAPTLDAHWSDSAFTTLRRLLGLRTELALFLVAESVAMNYFEALESSAPDPVLRGIGRRIAHDEREHLRFQVDRLATGFARTPAPLRAVVGFAWTMVAVGAATVLVIGHAAALRACGLRPGSVWVQGVRRFVTNARTALAGPGPLVRGPSMTRAG